MFKDIDTSRSWPNTGMTTAKWKQIPATMVFIDDLVLTQDGVYFDAIRQAYSKTPVGGDEFPHVVVWKGTFYLEDGHSRAMRRLVDGEGWMYARVLTIIDHG